MDKKPPVNSQAVQAWHDLQGRLEDQLNVLQKEEPNLLQLACRGIQVTTTLTHELVASIAGYTFEPGEEVAFYKDIKPYFLSRLIFYNHLYDLEMDRPLAAANGMADYYTKEYQRIASTYEQHRFIYRYIRSGATYLDEKLFFHPRSGSAVALFGLEPPPEAGHPVCYDHVVAQLLAGDLLQKFLQDALDDLRMQGNGPTGNLPRVTWTDSKTSLIELAYALQSAGVLNNGKIDLKDVIEHLQAAFHVNLGNYPRTFQEILSRKTGYTNFIDRLKDKLLLRIQHIEDKYDRG